MGHYEVLGVDPAASMDDIRKAYLRLARESHPDLHDGSAADRAESEARMRELNAAWAVLGNVDGRADYDRQRLSGEPRRTRPFHGSTRAHEAWKPFDDSTEEFDDADDRPITSSSLPRWLTMAPPVLVVGGVAALVVGSLLGVPVVVDVSIVSLVMSGILFLTAPIVALTASRREDRRP